MGKRNFLVYIGRTFWIKEEGAKTDSGKRAKCAEIFADFRTQKDRITEVYDQFVEERTIKAVKDDKRFLERCDFKALCSYEADKPITNFEGTFIDALIWIRENMPRIQKEHGD
ncbi:MAG: hypothetical protein LBN32_00310 [Helicobacteraceae bacterium]|nr:hypothetical protein [Helicobacteraceae bacterium]